MQRMPDRETMTLHDASRLGMTRYILTFNVLYKMKKILYLIAVLAAITAGAQPAQLGNAKQQGDTFFPMRQGAVLEYRYHDAKGKPLRDAWRNERFTRLTVQKMWGDTLANVLIENETLARGKGALSPEIVEAFRWGDVAVSGDEVLFDNVLWWFVTNSFDDTAGNTNHYRTTVNSAMRLPRTLKVGDTLPDLVHRSEIVEEATPETKSGMRLSDDDAFSNMLAAQGDYAVLDELNKAFGTTFIMSATGRRVVGREKITTPAGEFDCWRVEYELVGPSERFMGSPASITVIDGRIEVSVERDYMKQMVSYVDYFSPTVGLVRRDRLSAKGRKVEERMELISIGNWE